MAISIQIRRDTVENWNANSSVVLADGEIAGIRYEPSGIISAFKIGNGVSAWGELPYMRTGSIYTDTDIYNIKTDINDIRNDIDDNIKTDINDIRNDIDEISATTNSNNITALSDRISANTTNIETVLSGLLDLSDTVNTIIDFSIPPISANVDSLSTTVESLSATVNILAEASSNVVSLDDVNQAIESSISSLPVYSEAEKIQYLSSEISSHISTATSSFGEIYDNIDTLSSAISSLNDVTIFNLSSVISSKVSEADVNNIISAKADKTTLDIISSAVYVSLSSKISELDTNTLKTNSEIDGENVEIDNIPLTTILSNKVDINTPFSELSAGNLIISGNTISTPSATYTFVQGESNTIATLGDVTTISTNASKLSGITISPANISDASAVPPSGDIGYTNDTVWSISKDGQEEFNTIWAKLDYYNGTYQPTRLPSYNEVRTYVASEINSGINSHNINGEAHPSILSSIDTISAAVSDHYTYIDESFNTLSGYIGRISSNISNLSSHYRESDAKFSSISSDISDISSITITIPPLLSDIETLSGYINDKITQLSLTDNTLSGNFSDLSSDLDYVKYRVVALDEARWISLSSDSVELDGNPPSAFNDKVFGFYFSPKDILEVPESINNVSLKALSITTESASELSALDIIATAYIYDNNIFREIGRSSNYINISTPDKYIFTFYNCIAKIDSVIYIEFKNYATGETITDELPLVLHANDTNNIGVITSLTDKTTGSSAVFPTTDIVIDYVADVVVEIRNIKAETNEIKNDTVSVFNEVTSILSADNIVIAPSAHIQSLNSEELSTFIVSSNPRILTTTKLYGNTPEDTISCFPYTSTNEVLLKDEIYVTGTPGIGLVSSNVTLHRGDNITNILSNMFKKPLDIEVVQPSASFLLEDISSNTIYDQGKTYFYEFGTDLQLSAVVEYNDGKYISDPYSPSGTVDANAQPTGYSICWGYNSNMTEQPIHSDAEQPNIIAPNSFKFTACTSELYIAARVEHEIGNEPLNNFNETVADDRITATLTETPYIHLRPAGYGYIGIDNISSTTITSAEVVNNINTIYRMPDNLEIKKGSTAEINIPTGTTFRRFIIAYPSTLGELSELSASAVEIDGINYISNFEKHELDFRGATTARDKNPIMQYYVYTYASPIYWNGPIKFKVTI